MKTKEEPNLEGICDIKRRLNQGLEVELPKADIPTKEEKMDYGTICRMCNGYAVDCPYYRR